LAHTIRGEAALQWQPLQQFAGISGVIVKSMVIHGLEIYDLY